MLFYSDFVWTVCKASRLARKGRFDRATWASYSLHVLRALESVGIRFYVEGLQHIQAIRSSAVIVANHMSMMETIILPALVLPFIDVTFVVKQSLLRYPVFRHVLASRNPIAVTRQDPRKDLQTVLEQGQQRLAQGISVVVFPQTTRTTHFNPVSFNSIGVKLARRANVPVVPLALRTDAWTNGRLIKDIGRLKVGRPVHLAFGQPIEITGAGGLQHRQVIDFIQSHLRSWAVLAERNRLTTCSQGSKLI